MDHKVLMKTIQTQCNILTVQPMHVMIDPVRAYAAQIAAYTRLNDQALDALDVSK